MSLLRRSILALAAVVAAGLAAPAGAADLVGTRETAMGNPNAKVKVIEYASVVCPHCGQFAREVFPAFKRKYIDSGQVYFIFREYPTEPANLAVAGFLTARCAGPDKYFAVIEALFAGQPALYESRDGQKFILDAGKAGGLDEPTVRACLEDRAAVVAMQARVTEAIEVAKVHSTPTFIIGDKTLEGSQSLAQLDAVIQPLLAAR
jgi:protein-disulfide isomerase